tara:strand:+ start:850 stop:1218 length:369 start_codon:yes stop_codon:yes gene_type:complete
MPTTKKIICVVTGKPTVYSGDFLQKKIIEYGSEQDLNDLYICREVKSFLKKGYSVEDIRKVMNVDEDTVYPSEDVINKIEEMYRKQSILKQIPTYNDALTGFTYNKSDVDVENFINEYIIKT